MNIYCQPLTLFNFSTGIYNFISWTQPILNQVCILQFVPKCFCQHPTQLCVITSALIQYHVYQVIKTTTLLQTSFFCCFLCNSLTIKACSISLPCSHQVLLWSAHHIALTILTLSVPKWVTWGKAYKNKRKKPSIIALENIGRLSKTSKYIQPITQIYTLNKFISKSLWDAC